MARYDSKGKLEIRRKLVAIAAAPPTSRTFWLRWGLVLAGLALFILIRRA